MSGRILDMGEGWLGKPLLNVAVSGGHDDVEKNNVGNRRWLLLSDVVVLAPVVVRDRSGGGWGRW
jgi:hypothetical protein